MAGCILFTSMSHLTNHLFINCYETESSKLNKDPARIISVNKREIIGKTCIAYACLPEIIAYI